MAEHIGQPTRSRRFVKLYLSTWALLASGALAYLAVLAFPPRAEAPVPPPRVSVAPPNDSPTEVKVRQVKTAEVKALGQVQGSISEIRKDVSQLQEAVGERVINEKVVQTRLTTLEDRVSTIDGQQDQPPATPAAPSATSTSKVPGITLLPAGEPRAVAGAPFKPVDEFLGRRPAAPARRPDRDGQHPAQGGAQGRHCVRRAGRDPGRPDGDGGAAGGGAVVAGRAPELGAAL